MEARLWLCIFFALAIVSSSSSRLNFASFSGNEMTVMAGGRSLKMSLDDYGEPSANRGHDPPRNGGGRGRSRRD